MNPLFHIVCVYDHDQPLANDTWSRYCSKTSYLYSTLAQTHLNLNMRGFLLLSDILFQSLDVVHRKTLS